MTTAPMAVLETRGLTHRFGGLLATNQVSLCLMPGEIHGLIGPNGAGKTTLIHLLAGSMQPSAGTIWLDGQDITRQPAHRRAVAGLSRSFQITTIFSELSVLDNLLLGAQADQGRHFSFWSPWLADGELQHRAWQLARHCAIDPDVFDQQAATLPHGEQRKLEFALALAIRPRVLLLDEPMAGMSAEETRRLADLIEKMRGQYAILLVEHDMDVVFRLADRVSVLVEGKIIATGPPKAIRANPAVVQAYLGDPPLEQTGLAHPPAGGG